MTMKTIGIAGALTGLLFAGPGPARAGRPASHELSFDQTVSMALSQNPDLATSAKSIEAARHKERSSRALRLPQLSVDANVFVWDRQLAFDFAVPGMGPTPGMPTNKIVVRDRITSTVSATVSEPLSSQLVIGDLIALDRAGVAAARDEHEGARQEVAYQAADGYIRLLQARAALDIAGVGVEQIQAQLDRAKVLQEGGVLERVDLMRLQAALATARQRKIEANKGARLAEASLALVLGLPSGSALNVQDSFPEKPGRPPVQPQAAVSDATGERPDVDASHARADQARLGAEVAQANLYPNLLAVGTYQHSEGGGSFQQKNAAFVGLTLSWNVWDWGHNWQLYKQARSQAEQAAMAADRLEDRVALEVQSRLLEAESSYEALDASSVGLEAAEEAYRIQREKFDAGVGTTTDLLDAEADVTRARFAVSSARYDYLSALVALARATGHMPGDLLSKI